MNLCFRLSMPGRGSWDGRWTGDGTLYAVIRKASPKTIARVSGKSFSYSWSDGWVARVFVSSVNGQESRKIRKDSKGFQGYEWMIDSILIHEAIYADADEIPKETVASEKQ